MIEGGQGRTPKDIEDSAYAIIWCGALGLLAIGVAIIATYCS
jgi:hypothetical protein